MMDNYILLEVVHKNKPNMNKMGITIDINNYKFLKDLYNQYGDFVIIKNDSDEIKLVTD